MYVPPSFEITSPSRLAAFMEAHSFATLVTHDGTSPFASHLPMRFFADRGKHGTLVAHMARANPQWKRFTPEAEVLAIFQGPHAYVSPTWYEAELAVPTWNYAAVHAYGVASIIEDHAQVVELLQETVAHYEQDRKPSWNGDLPIEFRDRLIQSIVAFEIPLARLEGKFKFGQNRSPEDAQKVLSHLIASADPVARALAALMREELPQFRE
ncbi:MAG: FMN-binding negative transcriptional regulator [Planctomycetaceae bacterium]|nr:FMN-binding negative transcriptional regulator [Planctomycetaceae bacterium]